MATITNRQAAALEKLFVAQFPPEMGGNRLGIAQLPKRDAEPLVRKGLARLVEREVRGTGSSVLDRLPMTVTGYEITHAGVYAFGCWAEDNLPAEELGA